MTPGHSLDGLKDDTRAQLSNLADEVLELCTPSDLPQHEAVRGALYNSMSIPLMARAKRVIESVAAELPTDTVPWPRVLDALCDTAGAVGERAVELVELREAARLGLVLALVQRIHELSGEMPSAVLRSAIDTIHEEG